jgi:hypothetical protein
MAFFKKPDPSRPLELNDTVQLPADCWMVAETGFSVAVVVTIDPESSTFTAPNGSGKNVEFINPTRTRQARVHLGQIMHGKVQGSGVYAYYPLDVLVRYLPPA